MVFSRIRLILHQTARMSSGMSQLYLKDPRQLHCRGHAAAGRNTTAPDHSERAGSGK
jgi:hypothetical protein